MLLATRIGTALFALIALASGGRAMMGGLKIAEATHQLDNDHRFYAATFLAAGFGLAYCVPYLTQSTALFRFLMVTLMIGGLGRAVGWLQYPPEPRMMVAVAIELVVPVILMLMQARIAER